IGLQDRYEPRLGRLILDGDEQLDSAVEVSRHPVGAGKEYQVIAAVMEVQNPRVLQVAIDDAYNADILAQLWNARPQAANAANIQPDRHAGLRRRIQGVNDFG